MAMSRELAIQNAQAVIGLKEKAIGEPFLPVGLRLFTKDGRKIGNAIIRMRHTEWSDGGSTRYEVETEFGIVHSMSSPEIRDLFHLDLQDGLQVLLEPSDWRRERLENIS